MNFLQVYMRRLFTLVFLLTFSRFITAEDVITIAVLDFEGLAILEMETRALTNRLRGNLVKTGEYQVIERGKMDEILEEQGFQLSGCTSEGCIVEAGQLLGVEMMLAGSFSLVGATYSVEMRLIDIETGTITKSANFDMRGEIDDFLTEGMISAVNKLLGKEALRTTPELPPAVVRIMSNPEAATVFINDEQKGITPLELKELPAEDALQIKVELKDYETHTEELTLNSGQNSDITFTLLRKTGFISMTGSPAKSKLYLEGKCIGKLPLKEYKYPVGSWQLIAKKPEYHTYIDTVSVTPDDVTSVVFKMEKQPKTVPLICSAIIPGTGQCVQKHWLKGPALLILSAGFGAMAMTGQTDFTQYQDEYNENLDIYNSNRTQPDLLPAQRQAVDESFNLMKDAESSRNMFMAALGGVWTINIIDIIF